MSDNNLDDYEPPWVTHASPKRQAWLRNKILCLSPYPDIPSKHLTNWRHLDPEGGRSDTLIEIFADIRDSLKGAT